MPLEPQNKVLLKMTTKLFQGLQVKTREFFDTINKLYSLVNEIVVTLSEVEQVSPTFFSDYITVLEIVVGIVSDIIEVIVSQ